MKRYLTFFFLLIASIALCAYPEGAINNIDGSALGWDEANQVWRPIAVDSNGGINSGGTTIENISVDTSNIESYLKYNDGTDDHTQSEITNDIKTEVASISSNIGELIKSGSSSGSSDNFPSLFYTQRHKFVVPNTVTQILPLLPNYSQNSTKKRVFVELRAINPDDEFYIGFDSNTYDTEGRPVIGRILLNMPASQELYIYHTNQSDISIQQTEGWN